MTDQYLSVKETSEILNCSEQYVRRLLRYGEISGERISNRWIVASESVQEDHQEDFLLTWQDYGHRCSLGLCCGHIFHFPEVLA